MSLRILYTCLFYLMLPLVLVRLVWRGAKDRRYFHNWSERLGLVPVQSEISSCIWVHAVSAGESIAVVPLIRLLHEKYPERRILVTNMTPTGAEQVKTLLGSDVDQCYLPYDLPGMINRFLKRQKPDVLIIVDTELWPNTIAACHHRGIKVLLVNGRLSAKSARGYARVPAMTATMLRQLHLLAAQTDQQGQRFVTLGLPVEKLRVTGSIKFDLHLPEDIHKQAQILGRNLGSARLIWVAASTHAGEELQILETLSNLGSSNPELLLVLVPRHPERFQSVIDLVDQHGFKRTLHSENRGCDADTQVLIVDAMGVLLYYYASADLAFIGGSLVPVGGHNMMEAAEFALPLVMGEHLQNIEDIAARFVEAGALAVVRDQQELQLAVAGLLDESLRVRKGHAARRVMDNNRGALAATFELVAQSLELPALTDKSNA